MQTSLFPSHTRHLGRVRAADEPPASTPTAMRPGGDPTYSARQHERHAQKELLEQRGCDWAMLLLQSACDVGKLGPTACRRERGWGQRGSHLSPWYGTCPRRWCTPLPRSTRSASSRPCWCPTSLLSFTSHNSPFVVRGPCRPLIATKLQLRYLQATSFSGDHSCAPGHTTVPQGHRSGSLS